MSRIVYAVEVDPEIVKNYPELMARFWDKDRECYTFEIEEGKNIFLPGKLVVIDLDKPASDRIHRGK